MSKLTDLNLIANTLELSFVVFAAEEYGHEKGFPPMDKVGRLIEAITAQHPDAEASAEDILNHLFEKYNIE